jgi:Flp pilus assembly protein protease CpaA
MIELIVKHFIAFAYLLAGSISDIKTREVADWSNYGLIAMGISSNLIFSLVSNDWRFFVSSIIGFAVFFGLALLMFYTGQWGGGDSKMLMGLGALYGIDLFAGKSIFSSFIDSFLANFLINTLVAGAIYGIVWSIISAFRNKKKFVKELSSLLSKGNVKEIRKIIFVFIGVAILLLIFVDNFTVRFMLISLIAVVFSTFYLWLLIKSVENACMYKSVIPDKLTEGDWIAKDVKYNGKYITGPKDLGISKENIEKLKKLHKQNKINKILIKEGIPFVPSFFLGWIYTVFFGSIIGLIV